MKVRRDIASVPVRTAGQTWQAIIDLITGPDSVDAATLSAAASVMESIIADEFPATVPIVVKGNGPRLVIYLSFNEAAMEAGKAIDKMNWNLTAGDKWGITAPAEKPDVGWMNDTLKSRAPRIVVHDVATPPAEEDDGDDAASKAMTIDWGVLSQ